MFWKRLIVALLALLVMANAPSVAGCTMTHNSANAAQMAMDMPGGEHKEMPSSHHEMPCKGATPQCVDGTGCMTVAALTQPEANLTPSDFFATQPLPIAVNGHSLSIKPDIPPPIAIL